MMQRLKSFASALQRLSALEGRLARLQEAVGRVESRQIGSRGARNAADAEYRVFSQWGEDGIIDWLTSLVPMQRTIFVEFGVENYTESNTRFLLLNRNWSGLIFDSDPGNVHAIKQSDIYWQYNLKVAEEFITREGIDALIRRHGVEGDIGLLSIDIDGNDYWVWQALSVISPRIVVIEYNSRLGAGRSATVPYRADFQRASAHHSMIYYGASLRALWKLGRQKGYELVCCNSAGNNAFFVRADVLPGALPPATVEGAFVRAKFRESRDAQGRLNYLDAEEEERMVAALDWVEV
jgi:hypothetical protein